MNVRVMTVIYVIIKILINAEMSLLKIINTLQFFCPDFGVKSLS